MLRWSVVNAGKFLIVEGQVMESMRWQQRPLPCEVCDVSTAVFDGADGLALTSATSIGSNPVQVNVLFASSTFLP